MPLSIYFWIEITTLLVCVYCYQRFNITRYKFFIPYLLAIVLYEFGTLHKWFAIKGHNLWISNFEILVEYIFYSCFIISIYRRSIDRRIFGWLTLATSVFTLLDIFFIQGFFMLCSIAIVLQYTILIVMVCRFFYIKMQDMDVSKSLTTDPDFWVNTGLLFFFLAEFLFFVSFNKAYIKPEVFRSLFNIITAVANFILYSCLIIAFLCFRPIKTTSS